MRTHWYVWAFALVALGCAQSTHVAGVLTGVVVRGSERGAPVPGVAVSAAGANPVVTGNDGQFVLTFPDRHPGQDVRVRVGYNGWTVVNDVLPFCIGGAGATPPEDCGGVPGYADFVRAMADPNDSEHAHLAEWSGVDSWDPQITALLGQRGQVSPV